MKKPFIITIDGQASSGKSSIAKIVASKLNLPWFSSGRLYRMVGLYAFRRQFLPTNESGLQDTAYQRKLTELVAQLKKDLQVSGGQVTLASHNHRLTEALNSEEAGVHASMVAKDPLCRNLLLTWQRELAEQIATNYPYPKTTRPGIIFEGRDMGTVVFSDANLKFFLICSHNTRVARRWEELHPNQSANRHDLSQLSKLIKTRDDNDIYRKVAPLKPANDAITIDTTLMNLDQVTVKIMAEIPQSMSRD
ncbi:MAG: (d)CMP kinase [Proteobacteria bacterium]|nr:(d)CMP kinase [Pseudomonadota bacterium]